MYQKQLLTLIRQGFLRVVFSGGRGGYIWTLLSFLFQEKLIQYQYNFTQLSDNLLKVCWKLKNADIICYKLKSLLSL